MRASRLLCVLRSRTEYTITTVTKTTHTTAHSSATPRDMRAPALAPETQVELVRLGAQALVWCVNEWRTNPAVRAGVQRAFNALKRIAGARPVGGAEPLLLETSTEQALRLLGVSVRGTYASEEALVAAHRREILGASSGDDLSNAATLRALYLARCRAWHPDHNAHPHAARVFHLVQQAKHLS